MILATSGWIAGCKLAHGEYTAANHEKTENDSVYNGHWATGNKTKEHGGGDTTPAVADVEACCKDIEGLESTRRCITAKDCYESLLAACLDEYDDCYPGTGTAGHTVVGAC